MINQGLLLKVWKKIDELVDWVKITGRPLVGRIMELADNHLGPEGFEYLNEKWGGKIPEDLIDNVEKAFQCFIDDDYQGILDAIPEAIAEKINIKQLSKDTTELWLGTTFKALVEFISYYATLKKEEEEDVEETADAE